eukprot:3262293-Alexandrium_andersonii.AAC.1
MVLEPLLLFLEAVRRTDGRLDQQEEEILYWATSWGYSSAFDRVDPAICTAVWQELDVPSHTTEALFRVER